MTMMVIPPEQMTYQPCAHRSLDSGKGVKARADKEGFVLQPAFACLCRVEMVKVEKPQPEEGFRVDLPLQRGDGERRCRSAKGRQIGRQS